MPSTGWPVRSPLGRYSEKWGLGVRRERSNCPSGGPRKRRSQPVPDLGWATGYPRSWRGWRPLPALLPQARRTEAREWRARGGFDTPSRLGIGRLLPGGIAASQTGRPIFAQHLLVIRFMERWQGSIGSSAALQGADLREVSAVKAVLVSLLVLVSFGLSVEHAVYGVSPEVVQVGHLSPWRPPPLPAYLTEDEKPSPSPLLRRESGRLVQQPPPWAVAGRAPSTDGIALPPDPGGLSGWIIAATSQELIVASVVVALSIGLVWWAIRAIRRARRGELRALRLLAGLDYRRAALSVWLVAIALTTLWAPFKYVSETGHTLGPAPRQFLLSAENGNDYKGETINIVALDFQRLVAEWVGISAAGGALLVLTWVRR
jgi:hypothetical protein